MQKILITGGAGFIGSHVAEALLKQGHEVHILDDFSSGKEENVPENAVVHRMDVRDAAVFALFARERYTVLVHHAAQMNVRRSVAEPDGSWTSKWPSQGDLCVNGRCYLR
jgi:UDP-glucose 4-epimerase